MKKLLAIAAGSAFALTGILYGVYKFAFDSPNQTQNDDLHVAKTPQMSERAEKIHSMIENARSIPFERVFITSHDGLKLSGRYYHQQEGAPLDICFHGYRGTPARDFSGGIHIMLREGHNVLMVEERAHLQSEGHTITFGIRERYDVLDWIHYALDRFGTDTQIILVGISMGAATVLMASELELPGQVKGIVADCPYTAPEAIIKKVCRDMKIPGDLGGLLAMASARLFGGFDLKESSALKAAPHLKVPVLLIHGEEDHFVPCEMSRELYAANPEKIRLEIFPGAGHGLSFLLDPERYDRLVRDFSRKVLV
ncbi:MAG: alpha/beta hydrolase [Firmicutes bacterium]|nr:alpha/beta hydrolase [Bacillota bacterium]